MFGPLTTFLAGAIDRAAYAEFCAGLLRHISLEERILLLAAHNALMYSILSGY